MNESDRTFGKLKGDNGQIKFGTCLVQSQSYINRHTRSKKQSEGESTIVIDLNKYRNLDPLPQQTVTDRCSFDPVTVRDK
jgi:hypothetical protein